MSDRCQPGRHEWFESGFSWGGYIECGKCGCRPVDEAEWARENR